VAFLLSKTAVAPRLTDRLSFNDATDKSRNSIVL
jgi:hypothetical protein